MLYIAYKPNYAIALPEGHRFPMIKYELIPQQLIREGTINQDQLFQPEQCLSSTVLLTHDVDYYNKLLHQTLTPSEQRRIGFPQSLLLTQRELDICQGTIDCSLHALKFGIAMNIAGGTHHAFRARGEGFCLLNDFAIAANYLLMNNLSVKIIIIDLDVHQGNGTASIFKDDPRVFTFSMHGGNNYPFIKETSDLDIPLPEKTDDSFYLNILTETLPDLLDQLEPDFAFYLSGVDVLSSDRFGKLDLSIEGCRLRDEYVFNLLKKHNIPVTVAMGGGYSKSLKTIVEAHCNTFRTAMDIYCSD